MAGELRDRLGRLGDPRAMFESMFEHSPVPQLVFAADGHPVASNAAYRALFGRPPADYDVLAEDSARPGLAGAARRAFLGEPVRTPPVWWELGDRDGDGKGRTRVAVEGTFVPLPDGAGGVAHVALAYKDVSAEMEVARLRALADEMPAHVLENMIEAVTLSNERGFMLYTNSTADRMFGYARGELLGKHVTVLNAYPPEDNERIVADVIAQLHASGEWIGQWENIRKDGAPFTTRARITRLVLDGAPHWLCVQDDITEELAARRHADALAESLRARERQLRLITDSLPALVTYMGADRRFRFTNNAYMTWFGIEPQSLIGKHARELVGEVGYRQIQPYMERALAGEIVQYERDVTLTDGRTIYTQMSYVPDKDEQGRTLGYVALIHDMTDRHRVELELQVERKRLHDILMNAPAAIALRSGPEGVFTFVNATYQKFMEGRAMLGRTTREIHPAPTVNHFMELIERVYATGEAVTGTEVPTVAPRPDGNFEDLFVNVTYQPLLDAEGRIDSVISFAVDVTEQVNARRRAERLTAALQESEARYRSFVNQSTEGIWRIELGEPVPIDAPADEQLAAFYRGALLAECNDAMAKMYGYARGDELVDRPLRELLAPDDSHSAEHLRAFIASGYRLEAVESHRPGGDGRTRVFRNGLVGVVEDGRLRRAWGTQRDVTAEVEAREQAEAGNRAKDEFLALLGHELRNPLSPILTALNLMEARDAGALQEERAIIERQVEHVVRLVDDLLDVSRITRGMVSLERQRVDLAKVVERAIELASPLLEQRAHRLSVAVPPGLGVDGDPLRLSQVFANLLTNAAKYTPREGAITIVGEREGASACVSVRDTGIGIRPAMLPKVFDRFVQERQALDRSEGGLGLGLSIVRSLVDLHGGRVEARSEGLGKGSEFRVSLPLSAALDLPAPKDRPHASGVRPRGVRVLLVDDNEDAAALTAKLLSIWGQTVRVAHDGPSALRIVETFTPDLALLDIGLPAMDGYELARRLHAVPALAGVRLVAVTGYGQASDREAAAQAGFHEHLVKPVSLAILERVLSEVAETR
jgi:PAS domain S-box-containing protein